MTIAYLVLPAGAWRRRAFTPRRASSPLGGRSLRGENGNSRLGIPLAGCQIIESGTRPCRPSPTLLLRGTRSAGSVALARTGKEPLAGLGKNHRARVPRRRPVLGHAAIDRDHITDLQGVSGPTRTHQHVGAPHLHRPVGHLPGL